MNGNTISNSSGGGVNTGEMTVIEPFIDAILRRDNATVEMRLESSLRFADLSINDMCM